MSDKVMGFTDSFFVVAMDVQTMELCCKYGYPFLAWPQAGKSEEGEDNEEQGELKKKVVANSKFDVSYKLLLRYQSFFFFEMDVW